MIRVRPYLADDRAFVFSLAPRLTIGMPPWRDSQVCLTTVQGWITESIEQHGRESIGRALGFYHHLGYRDEDIRLVKLLEEPGKSKDDPQM